MLTCPVVRFYKTGKLEARLREVLRTAYKLGLQGAIVSIVHYKGWVWGGHKASGGLDKLTNDSEYCCTHGLTSCH